MKNFKTEKNMEYEGRICRPPMERASFMLPVMVGCSYNKCKFCNLFRDLKYRLLPLEQIEKELLRVKNAGGNPNKIFLGDGSAFGIQTEHLLKILNLIHTYFPDCNCINMDATVTSILQKTEKELKVLKQNGVHCLYIGIESSLDDILTFMNKDHNTAQAEKAIFKIYNYGYLFSAHIMTGIAGAARGIENAEALSLFLNKMQPVCVINFSMFLHNEVPLFQEITSGNFLPADELCNLKEEKRLLELLGKDKNRPIYYDGFHDFLEFRVRGNLPQDKTKMLVSVQNKINEYENKAPVYAFVHGECSEVMEKDDGNEKVWKKTQLNFSGI